MNVGRESDVVVAAVHTININSAENTTVYGSSVVLYILL